MKKPMRTAARLTADAMFVALYVLLACLLTIKTPVTEFSLCTVPIFLCAFLFGIRDALLVALAGSLIEQLIYGFSPTILLWMAPILLVAALAGGMAAIKNRTPLLVVLTVIAGEILLTVCNTAALYLDSVIIGYPISALAVLVPPRLLNLGIRLACTVWLVPILLPILSRIPYLAPNGKKAAAEEIDAK
ncbi:MAG: ECF transporter S component [Eubacteriales bacterium]|nr:ECF transporter S component [Eubacteriales bacterium]